MLQQLLIYPVLPFRAGTLSLNTPSCGGAPIDLLSDILKGQDLLNRKSEEITIHRDGM